MKPGEVNLTSRFLFNTFNLVELLFCFSDLLHPVVDVQMQIIDTRLGRSWHYLTS